MKIKLITILISNFISLSAFGQIFDNEQNPLSVKWKQIDANGFKIIYPTELEKEAQRMANSISSIYPYVGKDLKLQKTRIPIVFQNRGTQANGFVQLAPKKSQFYTTPPQQFDSQDWLNNLAVHELRHVAQFDKITGKNIRPIDEIFFGYIGISLPLWFLEGDAVSTETSLTNAGRGRQPSWIMPFRTSLLNGQNFSYSKSYFGSNKNVTPGYYQLGYLMTSNLRNQFGKNIIDSLLTDIHKRPLRLYPFSQSLKRITGKNTRQYYLQTLDTLKTEWNKQDALNQSDNYVSLNRPSKFASSYFFPQQISSNQIIALKKTKAEAAGFVIIDSNKKEKQLFKIGYQEQPYFNFANNILVWDEIREDPRYKQRTYSVICTYNLQTKTKNRLSFKSRLFSPSLSADGKKIIAVQINLSNQSNLVIIDSQSGKILETLPNPNNDILQTPALNSDASQVTWISVTEKGKSLWARNNEGKNINLILNTNQQLSRPIFISDKIAFNAHFSGVDNIYEIDINSKKIMALTSAKYGAFNPSLSFDQKSIVFNNYQLNGYEVAKTEIKPKEIPENNFIFFGEQSTKQENTGNVFEKTTDSIYNSKPYKPLAHLFAFHSISPNIDGNDYPGLQLKSNDLLNNLSFYTGITYNYDLKKLEYNAGFNFKAFYPVLSVQYKYRPRQTYYKLQNNVYEANWYENYLSINASLPLSFNAYNHNYSFTGEIGTSYTQRNFAVKEKGLFKDKISFPLNYRLNFSHQVRYAERDIAPKWAQIFNFKYFNQPFDKDLRGDLFAFESYFYFPGFFKNHSFLASFNYQTSSGNVNYGNEINTGFGYANIKAVSPLQNTLFAMYRFPFAFPDWEIGPLAYIKNFKAGAFINYENIVKETNLTQPKTFGFELRSTMNLLRYQPLFDIGGRVIFVNKTYNQNPIFELLFNYNF